MAKLDDSKLLKKVKEQVRAGITATEENMRKYYASQSFVFTRDGQFQQNELDFFKDNAKPSTVANRIFVEYKYLVGIVREMKRTVALTPLGNGPDNDQEADILQKNIKLRQNLIESISFHSDTDVVYPDTFASAYFGIGGFRLKRKYASDDEDDAFEQTLEICPIDDPGSIYWDNTDTSRLKNKGDYMGFSKFCSPDELKSTYDIDLTDPALKQDDYEYEEGDFSWIINEGEPNEQYRVCHHYYKKHYKKKIVLLSDGKNKVVCDLKKMDSTLKKLNEKVEMQEMQAGMSMPRYQKMDERVSPTFKIIELIFCGRKILEKKTWITRQYPVYVVFPTTYRDSSGNFMTIPESYFMEDVQRLQNFNLTALVESLAKYRTERWVMGENNLPSDPNEVRKWTDMPKYSGVFKFNADDQFQRPFLMENQEIPQGVLAAVGELSMLFNDVSGRSPSSQMSTDGGMNQSGGMVDSIAREDSQINSTILDNLEQAIKACASNILEALPILFDTTRTIALNNSGKTKAQMINDPNDPSTTIDVKKFDIKIDTGPAFELQKQQMAAAMMSLVQVDPQLLTVFGDLIAENMNVNDAQAIKERMEFILMPQIQKMLNLKLPQMPPAPPPPPSPVDQMKFQIEQKKLQLQEMDNQSKQMVAQSKVASTDQQQQLDAKRQQLDEEIAMLNYQVEVMKIQQTGQADQLQAQGDMLKARAEIIKAVESTHSNMYTAQLKHSASKEM